MWCNKAFKPSEIWFTPNLRPPMFSLTRRHCNWVYKDESFLITKIFWIFWALLRAIPFCLFNYLMSKTIYDILQISIVDINVTTERMIAIVLFPMSLLRMIYLLKSFHWKVFSMLAWSWLMFKELNIKCTNNKQKGFVLTSNKSREIFFEVVINYLDKQLISIIIVLIKMFRKFKDKIKLNDIIFISNKSHSKYATVHLFKFVILIISNQVLNITFSLYVGNSWPILFLKWLRVWAISLHNAPAL